MASVFGQIANASFLQNSLNSLAQGFKEQLDRKAKEELLKKQFDWQKALQMELAKFNAEANYKAMLGQYGIDALTKAAGTGLLTPDEKNKIFQGILEGNIGPALLAYNDAMARKRLLDEARQDKNKALELAKEAIPFMTDENQRAELQKALDSGDATKVLGVMADASLPWNNLDLTIKGAQAKGATAKAEQEEINLKFAKETFEPRVKKVFADLKLTDAQVNQIVQQTAIDAEHWGIEKQMLEKDDKLKDLLVQRAGIELQILQATKDDAIAKSHMSVEKAAKDLELADKQIAEYVLNHQLKQLQIDQQSITNEKAKLELDDYKATRGITIASALSKLAEASPEAAESWIKNNKDTLEKNGLDVKSLQEEVNIQKERRKYIAPERLAALKVIGTALDSPPPKEGDIQSTLDGIKKQLIDSGMDEREAQNYISLIKSNWDGALQDYQREQAKLQAEVNAAKASGSSVGDILKLFTEQRNILASRKDTLNAKRQALANEASSQGCGDLLAAAVSSDTCKEYKARYQAIESQLDGIDNQLNALNATIGSLFGIPGATSNTPAGTTTQSSTATPTTPANGVTDQNQVKSILLSFNSVLDQWGNTHTLPDGRPAPMPETVARALLQQQKVPEEYINRAIAALKAEGKIIEDQSLNPNLANSLNAFANYNAVNPGPPPAEGMH